MADESLADLLDRAQIEWPSSTAQYFIPDNQFKDSMTPAKVAREFRRIYQEMPRNEARRYADIVCNEDTPSKRIFALLLCCMSGAWKREIRRFLDYGIKDRDLPLSRLYLERGPRPNLYTRPFRLCSTSHGDCVSADHERCGIGILNEWRQRDLGDLDKCQWLVQAPIFRKKTGSIPHYDFHMNVVLPFVEDHEGDGEHVKRGGFSEVWGVRIHSAHQNLYSSSNPQVREPLLAVKKLYSSDPAEFKTEVDMLSNIACSHHQHLVKLLATYQLKGKFYMLFPYAKSNLRSYWDSVPHPYQNRSTYIWVLDQMAGLAAALNIIHDFRTNRPPAPVRGNEAMSRLRQSAAADRVAVLNGEELYGRHGDLKPENILWSDEAEGCGEAGILQITDFGLGRFHRFASKSRVDPKKTMGSATYIPPELTLEIPISQRYDIWSMGCIYLEFVTWLLMGSKAVYDFSEARFERVSTEIEDDTFFTIIDSRNRPKCAEVRSGVKSWINKLRCNIYCSLMLQDVLDLVEGGMLLVRADGRITAADLRLKLKALLERARADEEYLVGRNCPREDRDKGVKKPSETSQQAGPSTRPVTDRSPSQANLYNPSAHR